LHQLIKALKKIGEENNVQKERAATKVKLINDFLRFLQVKGGRGPSGYGGIEEDAGGV
jgi:hypothetical protein